MLAYLGAFTVLFIVIAIASAYCVFALSPIRGGIIDRSFGAIFGILRGILMVSLVFFSINITSSMLVDTEATEKRSGPSWFTEAQTYHVLSLSTATILSFVPESMQSQITMALKELKGGSDLAEGDAAFPGGGSRILNTDEKKIMRQVIGSLPKAELDTVYKKYSNASGGMDESSRTDIFRELLDLYKKELEAGKLTDAQKLSEYDLTKITTALTPAPAPAKQAEEGPGYHKKSINELERLINTLE